MFAKFLCLVILLQIDKKLMMVQCVICCGLILRASYPCWSMLHSYHCSNLILLCLFTDIQGLGVSPTVPEEQASYLVKML